MNNYANQLKGLNCFVAVFVVLFILAVVAAIYLFFGWLLSLAWGATAVAMAGWPAMQYWQGAIILWMLSLVGNFFRNANTKE